MLLPTFFDIVNPLRAQALIRILRRRQTAWARQYILFGYAAAAPVNRLFLRLAPDGELLFVEHGRAPDPSVAAWQDRLTPFWRRCAGGCHLNRPVDALIRSAGFEIARLSTGYMNALKPMSFMYEGRARPVQDVA